MLFSNLHARIKEEEKKSSSIDGRRFNKRSHERMNREVQVINRSIAKGKRKKASRKNMFRGVFSEEEIKYANEEKEKFRLECDKRRSDAKKESMKNESLIDESLIDESIVDESIIDESIIDESIIDESIIDESIIDETCV